MLTLHSNLIPQDQQPPYLLRPYPIALHTGTSEILCPVPYTMLGTTTPSNLLSTITLGLSAFPYAKNILKAKSLSDKVQNPFINFTLIV
jgi:hypothetical protein